MRSYYWQCSSVPAQLLPHPARQPISRGLCRPPARPPADPCCLPSCRLRREHGIEAGVPIILSTERPRCGLVYGGEEGTSPLDYQVGREDGTLGCAGLPWAAVWASLRAWPGPAYLPSHPLPISPAWICRPNPVVHTLCACSTQVLPNFRIRTIPVLGTTPAIFGLAAASWILCQLAGAPYAPEPHFRVAVSSCGGCPRVLHWRWLWFGSVDAIQAGVASSFRAWQAGCCHLTGTAFAAPPCPCPALPAAQAVPGYPPGAVRAGGAAVRYRRGRGG